MSQGWMLLSLIGFYGWVLSTVGFILKSFPSKGIFVCKYALRWGGIAGIFFAIWITSMLRA